MRPLKQRLAQLREKMAERGVDAMLVTSPRNRRYLSGFTGSSGYLLITEARALLITDFRYEEQGARQAPDFELTRFDGGILEEVGAQLNKLKAKKVAFEKEHVSYALYQGLLNCHEGADWIGVSGWIEEMRAVKTAEEIAVIKRACEIADSAFDHILKYIRPGATERDVAMELEFYMRRQGATSSSFDIIVASGERSALPHGVASEKKIAAGEMVTLDFGAYYEGYASDITRTIAVGEPPDILKQIYHIVLDAQIAGVSGVRAGMLAKEADALTRDPIAAAGYGPNFGHSTGHGIGLEVHEGPRLSPQSETELRPGMVVTIEPGIYIPKFGGVRIEDDVVITENGCEILTTSPKELIIL